MVDDGERVCVGTLAGLLALGKGGPLGLGFGFWVLAVAGGIAGHGWQAGFRAGLRGHGKQTGEHGHGGH